MLLLDNLSEPLCLHNTSLALMERNHLHDPKTWPGNMEL